ncbi:MAG: preprotein translocase subunit SecG [Mucinivorans sp.]
MYIFIIILIFVASLLVVLAVLAQNPKSGMAANFGASNAVMGVRQTADFLEKFTWGLSIAIVVLSLAATMAMPSADITRSNNELQNEIMERTAPQTMPDFTIPETPQSTATPSTTPSTAPATTPSTAEPVTATPAEQ